MVETADTATAELPPDTAEQPQHRMRLLEGMARAVAERGYADTTIADIVREASVSRRTFYEHFATKAECLMALYELASRNALLVLQEALNPERDWHTQLEQALQAYLECLARNPVLMRTLFIEILALGPQALATRRRVNQSLADFMLGVVNRQGNDGQPLTPELAMAVVGGINELVLQAIENDRTDRLPELVAPACALVRAVTRH